MNEQAPPSSTMYMEVNSQRYALNVEQIYMLGGHTSAGKLCHEHIIKLDEMDVDVKHCIVGVSVGEGAFICDMLSKSRTYLNGTRLPPLRKTLVHHGDVMRLGRAANIKFFNEQMETSHNSSGYGEVNKNTSDIICSSPESPSQRESSVSRITKSHDADNNFLVPAVPNRIGNISIEKKIEHAQNEIAANCRISLGLNSSNNQSDSFSIPETQHCKPRTSTASNLSLDESKVGEESTKSDFNLDSSVAKSEDDDDFCVPETQDARPRSQIPSKLPDCFVTAFNTLNQKSVDLNDSDDEDDLDGSQFRICTQDYNEGFGEEEENESVLHSQVIPFIKHSTVSLNPTNKMQIPSQKIKDKDAQDGGSSVQEEDKELENIDWAAFSAQKTSEIANNINSTMSTPDLFEFDSFDNDKGSDNGNDNNKNLFEDNVPNALEDEEDFMATQAFPSKNANKKLSEDKIQKEMGILSDKDDEPFLTLSDKKHIANAVEDEEDLMATQAFLSKITNNTLNEKDKMQKEEDILSGKEDEPFLTLSDKENLHPDTLEPIPDFPPPQLFAMREVSAQCSLASTSQRRSGLNQTEPKPNPMPSETVPVPVTGIESNHKQLLAAADEEDDILTQAFPHPSKSTNMSAAALPKNNCLNTTLPDQKANSVDVFKMPGFSYTNNKKTPPNTTIISESDIDLLMCTPQLIKDHLQFSKSDDIRKNILAAKNKSIFGDETDDGEDTEDDRNSEDKCLVQLTKVPKNSKDFDKLLPHLKMGERSLIGKRMLTDEQKAAKEACKTYKFNLSFGQEQDKLKALSGSSTTLSRDERRLNRDKERETAEKNSKESEDKKHGKRISKRTRLREADICEEATEGRKLEERKMEERCTRAKQKQVEQNTKDSKDEQKPASNKKEKTSSKNQKDKNDKQKIKNLETSEKGNDDEMQYTKNKAKEVEQNTKDGKDEKKSASNRKEKTSSKNQKGKNDIQKIKNLETSEKGKDDVKQVAKAKPKEVEQNTKDSKDEQVSVSKSKAKSSSKKEEVNNDMLQIQPKRRTTRSTSRSYRMDENDGQSDNCPTTSSTVSSDSRLRTRTRLNTLNSAAKSNTSSIDTNAKPERKRKSQVPVQAQVQEKRIKRTISQDSKTSPAKPTKATPPKYLISMTKVEPGRWKELASIANGLWAVAKDPVDSNILVMDKAFRTYKFLLAMARGIPIVTSQWLEKLNETKSLRKAPINEFLFQDPVFEKTHKFVLAKSLQMAREEKSLFKGYNFLLTTRIQPQPIEIKSIIESAGGVVLNKAPRASQQTQQIYLVSSLDDRKEWHKFRRLDNKIIIISTEAIMSSVMRQNTAALSNYELS